MSTSRKSWIASSSILDLIALAFRQSLQGLSVDPFFRLPSSCVPFAPPALPGFNATTDALTPARQRLPTGPQVSLIHSRGLPDHSVSNHLMRLRRHFHTLPLSATDLRFAVQDFASRKQARQRTRPNRVRQPTDWSFTSSCSPQSLTTPQLLSVTGWKAFCPERTRTLLSTCALRRTFLFASLTHPFGVAHPNLYFGMISSVEDQSRVARPASP